MAKRAHFGINFDRKSTYTLSYIMAEIKELKNDEGFFDNVNICSSYIAVIALIASRFSK